MRDLYERLKPLGFDRAFLLRRVLPDWWEDGLAANASTRLIAEIAIARQLGLSLEKLRDPDATLPVPAVDSFRLKRRRDTEADQVRTTVQVAQRHAELVTWAMKDEDAGFDPPPVPRLETLAAKPLRERILGAGGVVELETLADEAWAAGVAVIHLSKADLPGSGATTKRFDGLAFWANGLPVVVLASGRDAPPSLAFCLAHELGHLVLGHVGPGDPPLVDGKLAEVDAEADEAAADRYALDLLAGGWTFGGGMANWNAKQIAAAASAASAKHRVAAGTIALLHGYAHHRHPAAMAALKVLGEHEGGQALLHGRLAGRLKDLDLPEQVRRMLGLDA